MERYILPAGVGFDVDADFARAPAERVIELAPREYAHPRCVIGYIDGFPESKLSFLRVARVRVHVRRDLLREVAP